MQKKLRLKRWFIILLLLNNLIIGAPLAIKANNQKVTTKTRKELLVAFVKNLKIDSGFKNSTTDKDMNIFSTYYGIVLSDFLRITYDTYDVIYSIQTLQKSNYGFSCDKNSNASLTSTYYAVKTLIRLGIDTYTLQRWKIFQFANKSIAPILYNTSAYSKLKIEDMRTISQFLELTYLLNISINFPYNALVTELKAMQYTNGTYKSFNTAIASLELLRLLNQKPEDATGAINFLKAFRFNNTGFSADLSENITITDTYNAIQALSALGADIGSRQRIVEAILELQQKDGGFVEYKNDQQSSLQSTYYAYLILTNLNALNQLDQLAFLASTGYLDGFTIELFIFALVLSALMVLSKYTRNLDRLH